MYLCVLVPVPFLLASVGPNEDLLFPAHTAVIQAPQWVWWGWRQRDRQTYIHPERQTGRERNRKMWRKNRKEKGEKGTERLPDNS